MILGEFLGPVDLSGAQILRIHEVIKIVVVCEDKHLVLAIFQIVMPYLKGFDNSQKLAVMGFILSFCRNHFSQKERYQILLAQIGFSNYPIGVCSRGQLI